MAANTSSISYPADLTESRSIANASVVLLGRFLFVAIFLMSSFGHFSDKTIGYAASQGVPLAQIAVPISGLIALAGGLSIVVGYKAKIGAWLLVLFLVPVTFVMHRFWGIGDPQASQMQMIMFMKNISMLGGALLITQFGAGPASLDARRQR
jgi:putative oxidoreductase